MLYLAQQIKKPTILPLKRFCELKVAFPDYTHSICFVPSLRIEELLHRVILSDDKYLWRISKEIARLPLAPPRIQLGYK